MTVYTVLFTPSGDMEHLTASDFLQGSVLEHARKPSVNKGAVPIAVAFLIALAVLMPVLELVNYVIK